MTCTAFTVERVNKISGYEMAALLKYNFIMSDPVAHETLFVLDFTP